MTDIFVDSHVDSLFLLSHVKNPDYASYNWRTRFDLKVDINRLLAGKVNSCFLVLYTLPEYRDDLFNALLTPYSILQRIIAVNRGVLLFAKSPNDIRSAVRNRMIAISLGLENGYPIRTLDILNVYYALGVRYVTLCHNQTNHICDSSTDYHKHRGLSPFGHRLVEAMNALGMMIDISHASDDTVAGVLQTSTKPVIASHSGAFSVYHNPRNLTDGLLKRLAKNGGVVQVTMLPKCVGQNMDVKSFVNHIDHIRNLIGIDHIGIGSDFDGGGGIRNCEDMSKMGNIPVELYNRGYTELDVKKILGLNFMRVYEQNYKGKQE